MLRLPPVFDRLTPGGERNLADTLRGESAGGVLLLLGAAIGLVWANSPWAPAYEALADTHLGPSWFDLSVAHWASDGLLAIFFFVVGLELKREIVVGELRHTRTAVVPVVGAVGGMVVPALLYLAVNLIAPDGDHSGWAVPTATDIAFAVAVLGLVGRGLPTALRAFLLTLAVVDDLLAIIVIAVGFTDHVALLWLAASLALVAVFAVLLRRGVTAPWILVPLAVVAWGCMYASGVHATIAGVLLGLVVPAVARPGADAAPDAESLAERFEHRWRPVSAGFAVPVFALFSAGVAIDAGLIGEAAADPVAQGIVLGLVVGKPLGIVGATWLLCRLTRASLARGVRWGDVGAIATLGGIGFTVSLLVGALAFGEGSTRDDHVILAVLVASAIAALLGAVLLRARARRHAT